ncbi:beta strand repeat-containing protein [Fischerella sp. PCC 9605]|uniref:beta strand repeat-containing protein n=1 Tax=Fischerella sp. PCC 9605 TaxID=1173024 RepID=UPI0004B550EF|nr:S-layer family protein [Fischerella sp. PCC 9605]
MTIAIAQVTPDNTLGAENSVVTGDVINNIPSDRLDGGAIRGSNLFHSFQEFNVGEGRGVYFSNPAGIANILTRVTGGNPSNILGTLGVLGNANLFLINPKGIFFGPNARLNLGGSFFATTADSLVFGNNFEFSATNPEAPPLLTVNIPIGLRFRDNPGSIHVQGDGQGLRSRTDELIDTTSGLRVQPNQTLALVGGDVSLEGATLKTAGGRIELGSVVGSDLINITPQGQGFALGYDNVQNFGNIQLSQQTAVDASGLGGGDIQVWGRRITLTDGSQIETSTLGAEQGGTLVVNATEQVEAIGTSFDEKFPSGLSATTYPSATGDAGDLTINTRNLIVRDGARISARTRGEGDGGNLTVKADTIQAIGTSVDGPPVDTQAAPKSTGDAGNLTIYTRNLIVQDGAQISAGTLGEGKGGNLTVKADSVQLFNNKSGLFAQAYKDATGDAGDITIDTRNLIVQDGARISANTLGESKAGNLTVKADSIQLSNKDSGLFVRTEQDTTGDAGDLTVDTRNLIVQDGARISANTFGEGKAGNLTVKADSVQLSNNSSGLFAQAGPNATGDAGNLTIDTRNLIVQDGAGIYVRNLGLGSAGKLTINASSIDLDNKAILTADTNSNKPNPNKQEATISINSRDLIMRRNSEITANARGAADGGNINITTGVLVGLENSDIIANAASGNGGSITIETQGLYGFVQRTRAELERLFPNTLNIRSPRELPTSDITAFSQTSANLSGTVSIKIPDVDPSRGLIELLENVIDPSQQIAENPCQKGSDSTFIITRRGGLPSSPNQSLKSDNVRVDLVEPVASSGNFQTATINKPITHTNTKHIIPARGWVLNDKGEVVLTAYDPTATNLPQRASQTTAGCPAF